MKKSSFLSIVILILISMLGNVQVNARGTQNFGDTTSNLPQGTVIKNGQLHLVKGYVIAFSENKKIGTIRRANGNIATASVRCGCQGESGGKCSLISIGNSLRCEGDECCALEVTTGNSNLAITTKSGSADDSNITWKVLVIPKAKTNTTSN